MRRILAVSLVLLLVPWAAAADGFSHPREVLAGAWQIPFFYTPRATAEGESVRAPFEALPPLGAGPRYAAFVEEPLLARSPGSRIRVEVLVGDSVAATGAIDVRSRPSPSRVASVDEGGSVVLWAEDGAGGLVPLDTADASSPLREVLLLRTRDGDLRVVGATESSEAVTWSAEPGLRRIARAPLGGPVSCAAAGTSSLEGFFGLLDGRIVRVGPAGDGEGEVVASAGGIPTTIAVGDAGGDGEDDLAATVLEVERSNLVVWRGTGDGRFDRSNPSVLLLPATGRSVAFAPVGEELEMLVLLHGADVDLSGVSAWRVGAEDSIRAIGLPGISRKSVHRIVAGDWDGDGSGDIAVLTGGPRPLLEFYLVDTAGVSGRPACAVPVSGPEVGLLAGDFDGSGADDVMVAEGAFRVWLSDGTGRMAALPSPPPGRPTRLARLASP
jgi:hypothetical protein